MRAAVVTDLIGPDGVVVREVPTPTPGPAQVLIDVEYAGISFPDVLQTRGQYQVRPELPFTPGWKISGGPDGWRGRGRGAGTHTPRR